VVSDARAGIDLVQRLSPPDREVFERIYEVRVSRGRVKPAEAMRPWIEAQFGGVEGVLEQRIVRLTNRITLEETIFNGLRASRPAGPRDVCETGEPGAPDSDPFRNPYDSTPEDSFGRVEGRYCVTASNIAKYEGFHGVVVFKEANPLRFGREQVADYIDTGRRWAERAHEADPEARYFLFVWNCGGRAGASLPHGHAQVLLGSGGHYARVEHLRRCALRYREEYGAGYFDDLYRVHHALGCGFEKDGVRVMAYLSPVKEKELVLMADDLGKTLAGRLYDVLACLRDRMGVSAFNVALLMPPIAPVAEDWYGFPAIARVVDRGAAGARASDIGSVELYASTVVASDPFEVARWVEPALA
jgi:hypothetical protein